MSHTLKIDIQFRDPDALAAAVQDLKGTLLGQGSHRLYEGLETGLGFNLPGWQYPLVAHQDGSLAYDDFEGTWGQVSDLDTLRERYAIHAARLAAERQGWYSQIEADGSLLIFHPSGGTLCVGKSGTLEAQNFSGSSCSEATKPIAEALGQTTDETRKEAYTQTQQNVEITD